MKKRIFKNRFFFRTITSVFTICALIVGCTYFEKQNKAQKSKAANYNLVWSDEFNGDSLDRNNWVAEIGAGKWGNNELEYYTDRPSNVSVSNGTLKITARKENYNGSQYTSARLKTQGKKSFRYGKIEARIKVPKRMGMWPAFWMLGDDINWNNWPRCGEIDIMEHINTEDKIYATCHWDKNGHSQYGGDTWVDCNQFHTYSIEWDQTRIRWYVDGRQFHEMNVYDMSNTEEFHHNFFILLNMAVGGDWPGFNIDASSPATMEVDYVRVYQ